MNSVIMGNLDGDLKRIAFSTEDVELVVSRYKANIVSSTDHSGLLLELDNQVFTVEEHSDVNDIKSYFIVLKSGTAYNVTDYKILFKSKSLPSGLLSAKDAAGREYLCRRHGYNGNLELQSEDLSVEELDEKIRSGGVSADEIKELEEMVDRLKNGEFYEALSKEFSGKIRDIAQELIDFRQDLQKKLEPGIVEIAAKDIPEASNQLEAINETLEKSTMKIMDINEEQQDIANSQLDNLQAFISGKVDSQASSGFWEKAKGHLEEIKSQLSDIPPEAKELAQFMIPSIEKASGLISCKEEPKKIEGVLRESLATINDLVNDFGKEAESISKLSGLADSLSQLLGNPLEGEDETPEPKGNGHDLNAALEIIREQGEIMRTLSSLSTSMAEPLCFQDLVGQRIQKIVSLVKTMEARIEDLVISFGIKIRKHKEDPNMSFEDLGKEVEEFKCELKGPSREGEGLDQSEIDDILASL